MKQNEIEELLEYIDDNIMERRNVIIDGLKKKAAWYFDDFKTILKNYAGVSVYNYIRKRKLYYAFLEMISYPQKTNEVIAGFYFGASASQLCHSFKTEFGMTITEAKDNPALVNDNRIDVDCMYLKIVNEKEVNGVEKSINHIDLSEKMIEILDYAENEYGFSPDLCYDIAKVAERLNVPILKMIDVSFNIMADIHSDSNYTLPEYDTMADLDISSLDDLNRICDFYGCRYWELDRNMVKGYSNIINES